MAHTAVTSHAETAPSVRRMPTYRRLSWPDDVGELLRLHRDGLSQTAIAERLGCRQCTVSRWLSKLDDSTDLARAYLRGSAFKLARSIVENGRPRDHVTALQGIDVLKPQAAPGLTVIIGGRDDVRLGDE